jgi:hypothetical protein
MDDILGLEKRLKAALDRIAAAVGTMPDPAKIVQKYQYGNSGKSSRQLASTSEKCSCELHVVI